MIKVKGRMNNDGTTLLKYIQIPPFKPKRKRVGKKDVKRKVECPWKVLVLCNQKRPFYLCLDALYEKLLNDCMLNICPDYPCSYDKYLECMEEYGICFQQYCENEVNTIIDNLPIFIKNGQKMIICKCKPLKTLDGVITEREYLNDFSRFEPCRYRCNEVRKAGNCLLEENMRISRWKKHRDLGYFIKKSNKTGL